MENYYEVLGVPQDAPPEKIKEAYDELYKKYNTGGRYIPGETAKQELRDKAKVVLLNPEKRRKYDQELEEAKRDEFIEFIEGVKDATPTITEEQYKGYLKQAVKKYGLTSDEARKIIKDSGLVTGELKNYFDVLGLSMEKMQGMSESNITKMVGDAHKKLYEYANMLGGGRDHKTGLSSDELKNLLNEARVTLKDPQKRKEHIAALKYKKELIEMPIDGSTRLSFKFLNGDSASSVNELVLLIDKNWEESKEHLYAGNFSNWLSSIGRGDLVLKANSITANTPDQDVGLEKFVQSTGLASSPKIKISPNALDFGSIEHGSQKSMKVTIQNPGRGWLSGTLRCSTPGVTLSQTDFSGNNVSFSIEIDTGKLSQAKKNYQGNLVLETNAGKVTVPIRFYVSFPWLKFILSWLILILIKFATGLVAAFWGLVFGVFASFVPAIIVWYTTNSEDAFIVTAGGCVLIGMVIGMAIGIWRGDVDALVKLVKFFK